MPIYEYNCADCDHHFETIVLSAGEKITCPKCASGSVRKQLSVFSSPGASDKQASASAGCACTPQTCGCH